MIAIPRPRLWNRPCGHARQPSSRVQPGRNGQILGQPLRAGGQLRLSYQLRLELLELVASDQVLLQQRRELAKLVRDRYRGRLCRLVRITRRGVASISDGPKGFGQLYS